MQNYFQQLLVWIHGPGKVVIVVLSLGFAYSLVRRFRWSKQSAQVSADARNSGALPLDTLPLQAHELKAFDFGLGLGSLRNIVQGNVNGNEVVLFDSEVGHPHAEPTLQTIAAFRLSGSALPDFTLQPKSVLGDVLTRLGKGIDFGPDSDFSRDYFLTSPDENLTRVCFTPKFRDFFEGLERFDSKKNWHLQKRGQWVVVYRKGEGTEPDERQTFLEGTAEIVRNLEGAP